MEKKIVFVITKNDNSLGYEVLQGFEAKDGLNVLSCAIEFAMAVGQQMVGLTQEEAQLNIYKAVDKTLARIAEKD